MTYFFKVAVLMSLEETFTSISQWVTDTFQLPDVIYGELIWSTIILILFIVLGWIVEHIFEHYFKKLAKKTKTKLDDEIFRNVKRPIYILVLFFGLYYFIHNLSILNQYIDQNIVDNIFLLIEILLIAYIFTRVTNVLFAWYAERQERKKKVSQHILFVFRGIFNAIIYLIAFFIFMGLAGIDLTGLAIGGAATAIVIGFALQHVLSDFFSAFSIYFDRPFEIGDFIIIGDYAGTVKKIGMKSTRLELLQGEELVLSNKELTTASVRNFKKMNKRRIEFSFGVTYDTPLVKLKKIPDIIKKIINKEKLEYVHKLDRVHFTEFGDFSLNFNIIFYMNTKDYQKYRDTQQEINFKILEAFEKEGIQMAFPTQTIFLNK
jgi:small-conductance mechanosensitive channel